MRTVHAYTPTQQQEQDQQNQQVTTTTPIATSSSSSSSSFPVGNTNLHQHLSASGSRSVRHSLLRMHSQLRSAPPERESIQGPIDLSIYRNTRQTPKVSIRSTATASTTLRNASTSTLLVAPTTTHTIYSNAIPSSSSSSSASTSSSSSSFSSSATTKIATSNNNQDQTIKMQSFSSNSVIPKCSSSLPTSIASPKLAYSYSNIEENLQCPLCIDRLRDPRALPCQHVFCCTCLKSIPSPNMPFPTIVCPLCRRSFPYNGADQFPVSYIHRQLLELVPKNYDVNGKCTKCQEKTSLTLCSCCDYLLCQKCFTNHREKILGDIQRVVQTCYSHLNRIHSTCDQLNELNNTNQKKIHQVETIFSNFERKFFEHKQSLLHSLNRHNDQIKHQFWSKLNLSTQSTTEPFHDLLRQADLFMQKSHGIQFDDILSLFYNLNSMNEQLEHANALIDTNEIQSLLKQSIEINNNNNNQLDEQVSVHLNQNDSTEKIVSLLPSAILSRSTKRLRKAEPKRHIEIVNDDEDCDDTAPIIKQMKVECQNDVNDDNPSSPANSVLCLNYSTSDQQQNESDDDIIYIETVQAKSPATISFEELFQMIGTDE